LPSDAIFLMCVTGEDRCCGIIDRMDGWKPAATVICSYSGNDIQRDEQKKRAVDSLDSRFLTFVDIKCPENDPAKCLRLLFPELKALLEVPQRQLVIDMSVFRKRHLLMLWRWLDDIGIWDNVSIVYSEPEDYLVSEFIPLTFGLESIQQIPGFPGCADCSRPVHLVLFLGYEGDQALAVYEQIQPMHTTLLIPSPAYRSAWEGRTEAFNRDLLSVVGDKPRHGVDAIDPEETTRSLREILGHHEKRGPNAVTICPLGTKPQTLGVFEFLRKQSDPPAVIYANPLRHSKSFSSHGIGNSWILKATR
jgi:hypothetical protein